MPWIKSCLCQTEKKKPFIISAPIHVLLKNQDSSETISGSNHVFRCKIFKKPRLCHLCHQHINNQGLCCRVCKYICHTVCESKEAAQRYTDTSWQIFQQNRKPSSSQTLSHPINNNLHFDNDDKKIISNLIIVDEKLIKHQNIEIDRVAVMHEPAVIKRSDVNLHAHDETADKNGFEMNKLLPLNSYNNYEEAMTTQPRFRNLSNHMDLSYVTERIIAIWFPSSTTLCSYREGQRQAADMLKNKHGNNYMVFNLSEPKRALRNEHKHVKEVGWSPNLAPPLEKLCSICKEIESWLSGDQHRIAVLHARGNNDKLGVVVAAYMHYSNICGNSEQALDRFSMRKFIDDNIGPLLLPSNKRYVDYFAGLLSHNIKINADPLYLTHVTVLGTPAFQQGGCKAFLKLYEGQTPIYTSGVYSVSEGVSQFTVNVAGERRRGLQIRGDILIKCYHRSDVGREIVFACQFHTCAVADHTLSFIKNELDFACNDSRFPVDGAVELHFSSGTEGRHSAPAPTPAVPFTLTDDSITRVDSPLHIETAENDTDSDDVNHTFGPLDGSIYATIIKKSEFTPDAVSSQLTVSMDSGISSAGHQQNANTNTSTSSPPTAHSSPLAPEDQHRELDELLSDMMLTVQSIPDLKLQQELVSSSTNVGENFNLDNVRFIDQDEEDKNIPYHARQDSQPFSYGVSTNMISESKNLSSPSLVRRASINKSSGDTLNKVQTQVYPDFPTKPVPNFTNSITPTYNNNTLSKYSNPYSSSSSSFKKDPINDIFTDSALSAQPIIKSEFCEEYYKDTTRYHPLKRSLTESALRQSLESINNYKISSVVNSPYSDSESLSPPSTFRSSIKSPEFHETYAYNNLTWLQRQQQKLRERKEIQLMEERQPHETRLLSELRCVQSRHMRPSASHRIDGYTSDTTAFVDDDYDYKIPLHINTLQKNNNTSTANYSTLQTTYSTENERPFVSIKRAHERNTERPDSTAASLLAANPLGQIIKPLSKNDCNRVDTGLLSKIQQHNNCSLSIPGMVGIDILPTDNSWSNSTRINALNDLIANLSNSFYKINNSTDNNTAACQFRDDAQSTWRSQSLSEVDSLSHNSSPRPQTPAFPVIARTPYINASTPTAALQFDLTSERLPPKSPTTQRKDRPISPMELTNGSVSDIAHVTTTQRTGFTDSFENYQQQSPKSPSYNGSSSPTGYYGNSRRNSDSFYNELSHEVSAAHVKFVRDTSKFWYKPNISREEAINMLRDQAPGTFVVRDSNSFPGAFGMALRVATVPSNVQQKSSSGTDELIRHFLIEPTSGGVRLKGCQNEPVFSSLSALVYQHSVTQMALPCHLILPEGDLKYISSTGSPAQQLLIQGAACNVMYLFTVDMESLTGPQAIKKAVSLLFQQTLPSTAIIHFKVNDQGVTLTDNKRKLFFRRHYPIATISHCGLDPEDHKWTSPLTEELRIAKSSYRIFGFVARKRNIVNSDNQCHLFAELEPEQPAAAIVNFVNKVLTTSGVKLNIV